jgi:S-adenosylmethionine synthetase
MTVSLDEGEFMFTSESVTEGHPDKIADQISDAVLDTALAADPYSRVACETVLTTGLVLVAGEITTSAHLDIPEIVRSTIRDIGYTPEWGVDMAHEARRLYSESELDRVGAGDQGMMFGYATNETLELMPMPISLAHRLARQLAYVRKSGQLPFLRPDGKTQVTVRYSSGVPVAVEKVLISAQHEEGAEDRLADQIWDHVVRPAIPPSLYDAKALRQNFYVNPTGRFVVGGPVGDAGLTGRKIIVDTYGGFARHGGGAFSGKDPSKVDRSAAYAARYVAKNVVAAGLADRLELQVAYAIGVARPLSLFVETFGTEHISKARIIELINEHFDLRPAAFREYLKLHRPVYRQTAAYGHFGRDEEDFTWEHTDKAQALRESAMLVAAER